MISAALISLVALPTFALIGQMVVWRDMSAPLKRLWACEQREKAGIFYRETYHGV